MVRYVINYAARYEYDIILIIQVLYNIFIKTLNFHICPCSQNSYWDELFNI